MAKRQCTPDEKIKSIKKVCTDYNNYLAEVVRKQRQAKEMRDSKKARPKRAEADSLTKASVPIKTIAEEKLDAVVELLQSIQDFSTYNLQDLSNFTKKFEEIKPILSQRNDSAGITFLKVVGLILAGVATLGAAAAAGIKFGLWGGRGQRSCQKIEAILAMTETTQSHQDATQDTSFYGYL